MRLDQKLSPRDKRRFQASQRRYNTAMAGVRLFDKDFPEPPSTAKRRKVAENKCEAFKAYRKKIIDLLAGHIQAHTVPTLLRELPTGFSLDRLSRHQQLNVHMKASVVLQYCTMFNDTYDETPPFHGWTAKQIATAVGRNFRELRVEKVCKPVCGECDVPGNEPPDVSAGATPSYTTSEARERSLEGDADSSDAEPPVTVKAEPKVLQPMSASCYSWGTAAERGSLRCTVHTSICRCVG